jgi:hypothetical protein
MTRNKPLPETCPICSAVCKEQIGYLDGWCVTEAYVDCPNGCYSSECSYGNYSTHIEIRGHRVSLHWASSSDRSEFRAMTWATKILIFAAILTRIEDSLKQLKP